MNVFALPLARILLSLLFIFAGYAKVLGFGGEDMAKWKESVARLRIPVTLDPMPEPDVLAQVAAYGELVGGIMLLLGILSRLSAFGLLAFTIAASVLGHAFWDMGGDTAKMYPEIVNFLKRMGITGGLLLIIFGGGGTISIDAMFRRGQ
jgi:putative oxidoreductase